MSPRQSVVVAGGLGSGKSTVIDVLAGLGWSVIKADEVGHDVLRDPEVLTAVADRWPEAVLRGAVSRPALAGAVFADPSELTALEAITHPAIIDRIEERLQGSPEPTAVEVSVLKVVRSEWGTLVIVHAPLDLRKKRALERGMTPADVEARMEMQPSDTEWLAAAELVIDNHASVDELAATVHRFDRWARMA